MRPVGVAVGRGGRIFVSSLVMAGNEASPVSRSEIIMITRSDDTPDAPFPAVEETAAPKEILFAELENTSWHRRYRAHIELLRRGRSLCREAASRLATAPAGSPLHTSLLWLAAVGGATKEIEPLAASRNDNARLQAIRALSRFGSPGATCGILEKALADPNLQVAHAALIGLFDRCGDFPRQPVFGLAESGDSFLVRPPAVAGRKSRSPNCNNSVSQLDCRRVSPVCSPLASVYRPAKHQDIAG
jgi:hypothetical protein